MKLYEKLGIDLNTVEGLERLQTMTCSRDMPCSNKIDCPDGSLIGSNAKCRAEHLLADVPTKKRWQTIQSDDDVRRMFSDTRIAHHYSSNWFLTDAEPLADYLLEEVDE